jgi:hypothetical protein
MYYMVPSRKWKAWNEGKMNEAVGAVANKGMRYLKASKYFGVPQTTLERCVKQS